jgi:uncharacterized pyridoxamine 5'-phosphate oxidase family protein
MKDLVEFLKANPLGCLATVTGDGAPNGRPFQFMMEEEGRLYFCTSNKKEVFRELKANPRLCFSAAGPDTGYLRIWGEARFVDGIEAKQKVIDASPLVKSIYGSGANPDFEVFYVGKGSAFLGDLKGTPAKTLTL